jgi:hypothetical protein
MDRFESEGELELEPMQTHMTQKPLLWIEVGVGAEGLGLTVFSGVAGLLIGE